MPKQLFTNNASAVLTVGVNTTFTTLTLDDASKFPSPTAGDWFTLALIGLNTNGQESSWEIVTCTARTGNTLTVTRAQEGTVGVAWGVGTRAEVRLTSAFANKASDHFVNISNPHTVTKTQVGLSNVDNTSNATERTATATLTNKSIALGSNTITGTLAQFNTAVSDADLASLAGTETLTNKTFNNAVKITDTSTNPLKVTINPNETLIPLSGDIIASFTGADASPARVAFDAYGGNATFIYRRANGTALAPTGLLTGDPIGNIAFFGHDGVTHLTTANANIIGYPTETWSATAHGCAIRFKTTANGVGAAVDRYDLTHTGFSGYTDNSVTLGTASLKWLESHVTNATVYGTLTVPAIASSQLNVVTNNYPTIRPTLNLDFENNPEIDPRITFTRASNATYTDQDGLIKLAPANTLRRNYDPVTGRTGALIEGAKTNLLAYSENFDNAAWDKTGVTVTANSTTAPDGTVTADTVTGSGFCAVSQTITCSPSTVYVGSAYLKAGTTPLASIFFAFYDVTAGAFIATAVAPTAAETINGFTRYWYSVTSPAGCTSLRFFPTRNTLVSSGDFYIWGAQLEAGAFPTSYIPSNDTLTSRASTATYIGSDGLLKTAAINEARYEYNPLNLGLAPKLLLEGAATNLLVYSGAIGGPGWDLTSCTATLNNAVAPDGTTTATLLNDSSVNQGYAEQVIVITGDTQTRTYSCYLKQGTAAKSAIVFYALGGSPQVTSGIYTEIEWATGTVKSTAVGGTVTTVGGGWYRFKLEYTNTNNTTLYCRFFPAGVVATATGTCYIWGAQLEIGTLSSYIPTTTTAITRSADVSTSSAATRAADLASITGSNFSDWYSPTEGSFVVDSNVTTIGGWITAVDRGTATYGPRMQFSQSVTSNKAWNVLDDTGTIVSNAELPGAKAAFSYKTNDFALSVNGSSVATDVSGAVPTGMAALQLGRNSVGGSLINGHIYKLSYYPKRLTNLQLQAISTQ